MADAAALHQQRVLRTSIRAESFCRKGNEVPVVKHGCIIRSGLLIEISPKDDHATETDDSALPHVLILILLLQKSVPSDHQSSSPCTSMTPKFLFAFAVTSLLMLNQPSLRMDTSLALPAILYISRSCFLPTDRKQSSALCKPVCIDLT